MKKFIMVLLIISLFLITGYAQAEKVWVSPLTAIPVGPSGPATNLLTVEPYSSPSTAIEIKSTQVVSDGDLQWVILGLTTQANKVIKGIQIYYDVDMLDPNLPTFISQVRLTQMTTPDVALVIHDDPTDLTSTDPTSYVSLTGKPKPKVRGTITLELKVVLGSIGDSIRVGGISLIY